MYCSNPTCPNPLNSLGRTECEACQSPLTYRYLWAVGLAAADIPAGELLGDRYQVVTPQVWLDTKPGELPFAPEELPDYIIPYLFLYSYRIHVPEVYGFYQLGEEADGRQIVLLENAPLDGTGHLLPSFKEAWPRATAVRQFYWLWQIAQLWTPLSELGVASSLLSENLRVDSWRVRLLELEFGNYKPTFRDLADFWFNLSETAQPSVQQPLQEISYRMVGGEDWQAIAPQLNELLLEEAAKLPLNLEIAGATTTGPVRLHNEDSCYPTKKDLQHSNAPPHNQLIPRLAIICDGVGGHEGGEVASQLGIENLKLMVSHLIAEAATKQELMQPELVSKQLEEIIRVVNNAIAAKNDEQKREYRQRMGTTLVMALQLPQKITSSSDTNLNNAHELYVAHVGDSRAYWLTADSCQQLTVDDDVAAREVMFGRCLYWEALQRPDAGALTQALGTRDGEFIRPTVRRFIIEDNGLLLLCSDGLSDNDWIEKYWHDYASGVLNGEVSVEVAVESLIDLANKKNGHDNTSVVLVNCRVAPQKLALATNNPVPEVPEKNEAQESEMSQASKDLLYDETVSEPEPATVNWKPWLLIGGLLLFLALAIGIALWRNRDDGQKTPEDFPYPWETPVAPPSPQ